MYLEFGFRRPIPGRYHFSGRRRILLQIPDTDRIMGVHGRICSPVGPARDRQRGIYDTDTSVDQVHVDRPDGEFYGQDSIEAACLRWEPKLLTPISSFPHLNVHR